MGKEDITRTWYTSYLVTSTTDCGKYLTVLYRQVYIDVTSQLALTTTNRWRCGASCIKHERCGVDLGIYRVNWPILQPVYWLRHGYLMYQICVLRETYTQIGYDTLHSLLHNTFLALNTQNIGIGSYERFLSSQDRSRQINSAFKETHQHIEQYK
ncbi:hypothetical protein J6590_069941 [Homalodisca vitripennis]|nr:hypothetical protein J6590_069941 [Homalodisca vitripennis]